MILKRDLYLKRLHKQKDKDLVKIITGVRRCGKSTLLFDLYYQRLLDDGVPADHIIRIAIDNIKNKELLNPMNLYDDPFNDLGNGYKKINMLDFLLDEESLEKI